MKDNKIHIAVVDDHGLFRKGMMNLLSYNPMMEIVFEASNGKEFIAQSGKGKIDLVLMDIEMPVMNGFELAEWINKNMPETRMLVLSMVDNEEAVVKMVRHGIKGFLSKDIETEELNNAIATIVNGGYYYTDFVSGIMVDAMEQKTKQKPETVMSDKELQFLKLACSEFTYKEIADQMFLSIKTVDGYRASLFEKLNVKSRVGLVLYAIRNDLVEI
jgi:two-component system, NarL family, invasion response regulator UvrY